MRTTLTAAFLAWALAACASAVVHDSASTPVGRGVELSLPASPDYPGVLEATQHVIGQYGDRRVAFDAVLSFSPEIARIVLTSSGGPRILSLEWTKAGVVEDRTALAPADLDGLNILADIFLSLWPVDAVRAALSGNAEVEVAGAIRRITKDARVIVEIEMLEDSETRSRRRFSNVDLGYVLTIVTEKGQ